MESKKIRILAIDDNKDNLVSLTALIKDEFPEALTFTALSGTKGIELAKNKNPDVILLDIVMPGMDGYEVCQKLKADNLMRDIPVVFITALKGDKESRIRSLRCGGDAFLAKPIDQSELIAQIRAMVRIKESNSNKRNEKERLKVIVHEQTKELKTIHKETLKLLDEVRKENAERKIAEQDLLRKDALLKITGQTAKVGGWEIDTETMNQTWTDEVFVIHEVDFTFKPNISDGLNFYAPLSRPVIEKAVRRAIEFGEPFNLELEFITNKGNNRWVHSIGECHQIDGITKKVYGSIQDITKRKLAEMNLKEKEESLSIAQKIAKIGSWEMDPTTKKISWSKEMFDILEVSTDQEPTFELYYSRVHPDDLAYVQESGKSVLSDNEAIRAEYRLLTPSKTIKYVTTKGQQYLDNEGNLIRLNGIVQDITERKLAEKELFHQASLIQQVQNAIITIDLENTIISWNKHAEVLYQWKEKEVIGKDIIELLGAKEREEETLQNFVKLNREGHWEGEYEVLRKDGTYVSAHIVNTYLKDPNGNNIGFIGISTDISERIKAELEIIESKEKAEENEKRFNDITYSTNDWVWEVDEKGVYTYTSEIGSVIFGIPQEEIIGKTPFDFMPPDEIERVTPIFSELAATKSPIVDLENWNIDKNGERILFLTNGIPIFDKDDNFRGYRGVDRDITRRKQAEEQLRLSSLHWSRTFDSIQDGVTILDADQNIIKSNKAFLDLVKKTEDEMVNQPCFGFVHKTSCPVEDCPFVLMKKSKRRESMMLELGDQSFEVTVDPIFDDSMNISGAVHTIKDLTKKIQLELEMRGLASIIDRSINEIYIFNQKDFGFVYVNPGALSNLGYEKEEILSMTPIDIKPGFTPESFSEILQPILKHKEDSINFETVHKRKDGTNYPVDVFLQDGNFEGKDVFVAIIIDITDRKTYEYELISAKEKAEESDRLKSAFLTNMSHEIRTPMNGILGFTQLLNEPDISSEDQQSFIQTIQISGSRMLSTINSIIDIAKIESGIISIDIKETDINEKMEFAFRFFEPEVEEKRLKFTYKCSLPSNEVRIQTDSEKVYGILTNLIKNAVKFTYDGSIEFGYEKKGDYLEFFVKDTGIGISESQKKYIFERFRQGSESHSRDYEGSGLGLSISNSYVGMLGGKMWVESEQGLGSTFYFTIPYVIESMKEAEVIDTESKNSKEDRLENLKILIVEDDEVSYSLLRRFLRKISKEVLHAVNGIEAIEACKNNSDLDLVLMDIRMPMMSGLEATRQIRSFNKELVIIAQTAFGFENDRKKALEAGCSDFITKPINSTLLIELINKHVNKKKLIL